MTDSASATPPPQITRLIPAPINAVLEIVAMLTSVTVDEILGEGRSMPTTHARGLAMFAARELVGLTYVQIGEAFGRDHTTVVHACQRITQRLPLNPALAEHVVYLRHKLGKVNTAAQRETAIEAWLSKITPTARAALSQNDIDQLYAIVRSREIR